MQPRWSRADPPQVRDLLKRAYYAHMGEQPAFQHDWAAFGCRMASAWEQAKPRASVLAEYLPLEHCEVWLTQPRSEIEAQATRFAEPEASRSPEAASRLHAGYRALLEVRSLIEEFAARWALPDDGLADVWRSWTTDRDGLVPMFGGVYPWASPDERPVITPPSFAPFVYDPVSDNRQAVRERLEEMCRQLREEVNRQADEYERRTARGGWRPMPPAYRDPDNLRLGAERLYLRAVGRKSWQAIALKTARHRSTVKDQVQDWAALLGTPLPAG